jgi:hypothetical protein
MATQTESVKSLFEEAFENLRKAAESSIEVQQNLFRQWSSKWPGFPQPQASWVDKAQKFQKDWAKTVKELLAKHREILDEQYEAALRSLDEAFRLAQSADPQEFASRCEALCRKSLEALRDVGEMQVKETQEALNKWMDLATKSSN